MQTATEMKTKFKLSLGAFQWLLPLCIRNQIFDLDIQNKNHLNLFGLRLILHRPIQLQFVLLFTPGFQFFRDYKPVEFQ